MTNITTVDRQRIMYGTESVPISENYKDDVTRFLDQHTLA